LHYREGGEPEATWNRFFVAPVGASALYCYV